MTQLESVRSGIEHFVSAAAEAFRVEAAVFNQESRHLHIVRYLAK